MIGPVCIVCASFKGRSFLAFTSTRMESHEEILKKEEILRCNNQANEDSTLLRWHSGTQKRVGRTKQKDQIDNEIRLF